MERKWQRTRDRRILEMIRGLLQAEVSFQQIFKKYKKGLLRFSDVEHWVDDRGESVLYLLKEQCHTIFRFIGIGRFHKKEWLLDLVIGSIFHEAMKLRENVYQLEVYRPKYLEYKSKVGKTAYEKDYLTHFEKIISRAEEGVAGGIEETQSLFHDAKAQLLDFFKTGAENPYLVRFLLEHEPLLEKVYGTNGAKRVFDFLFCNGLSDACLLAGQSYLDSEHYDLSSFYFSKALKLHPHDHQFQSLLNFSHGMGAYYRNDYPKALFHFFKLAGRKSDGKLNREYLKKTEEACRTMAAELMEEKGRRSAGKARSVAERIRRML